MFDNLPNELKEIVLHYLEENNFPAAKEVYDRWHNTHPEPQQDSA